MRILVADDQRTVRFALRALLQRQPGLKVVGEATDAPTLLAETEQLHPDLVLLDWELPGREQVDMVSALRSVCPGVFVIALSGRVDARRAALEAQADFFVSKGDPPERLLAAIGCCEHQRDGGSRSGQATEGCSGTSTSADSGASTGPGAPN